jgi:hypothetical protein
MVAITFNARERRLVLAGSCSPGDGPAVERAVGEHVEAGRSLVLDLTRLADLPLEVASGVEEARRAAERDGCWISVWTIPGTAAAEMISAARDGGTVSSV